MVYICVSIFAPKSVIGIINHPTYRRAVSWRLNNLFPHQKHALCKVPQYNKNTPKETQNIKKNTK